MPSPPTRQSKRYRPHVPLNKRQRAVKACISCRDGKKKCVMASANQCQSCARVGQDCVFERKPEHRDDTLSQEPLQWNNPAWDAVVMDVSRSLREGSPGVKLDSEQFSIISKLFRDAVQKNEQILVPDRGISPGGPSSLLHRSFRPSVIMETQPNIPSTTEVVCPPSASHASFLAAISDTISSVHTECEDIPLHLSSLAQKEDSLLLIAILSQLPPYEDAQLLVDVFFIFLESNWYYFDEKWFRGLLTQIYMYRVDATQRQPCTTVCLVFLTLALGSTFEHLLRPANLLDNDRGIPGSTFFVQATRLMPRVIEANSVESAICCLLASLYLLATEEISHHHIYLGLALNLAVSLSLHRAGMGNNETSHIREPKVRLFWTIYSLERQTSVIMGLPTMLQRKDITVSFPQTLQSLEKDDSRQVDRLIAFTKLTMVMDDIIDAGPIEKGSTTYDWACWKLESWKQSVPPHLLLAQGFSFRADAHLNMMYNMIWVNIGRGATLRLVRARLYPLAADPRSFECDEIYLRSQKLAERCTGSAAEIVNWVVQLHDRNLLARFSFTDLHTCSSAVIVLLLNSLLRNPYQKWLSITRGIEAMRFMADGSVLAINALRLVECLQKGVYKVTGVMSRDGNRDRQLSSLASPGQNLSHDTLNLAGDIPYVASGNEIASENSAPDIAPLDTSLFTDLEPSLLEYSEQYLTLFGFDGFSTTLDPNFSL